MQVTENTVLIRCGASEGTNQFGLHKVQGGGNYLLLMCSSKGSVRIYGESYAVRPFTFMMVPFEESILLVQHSMTVQWAHLRLSSEYLQMLTASGMRIGELQPMVQPLSVAAVWKIMADATDDGAPLMIQKQNHAVGLLLCLLIQDSAAAAEKAMQVPHYDKLTALRREIYRSPAKDWYIQDICEDLCISRPYFHKIYLSAFGTTCTQDVIESRIAYAQTLLRETDDAISEISQKCGFETDVYFMRQFKRHSGMTPTAYRRVSRQESMMSGEASMEMGKKYK